MTTVHVLKCMPCYFQATINGEKPFEIRDNSDRAFQRGDLVRLEEYIPEERRYTDRICTKRISFVTNFAQKENYVVFGLTDVST